MPQNSTLPDMHCYEHILWPLLRRLSPERAHKIALAALKSGVPLTKNTAPSPLLSQKIFDLQFNNPLGIAAGFDKNAEAIDGLMNAGFGFVEAGTVTPLPQPGNPPPRMFRLEKDRAVINRLGFNNKGLECFVRNLRARKKAGIVGANIGKNKGSHDAVADYISGLKAVYPYVDYITINISSPNTEGLRDLQSREALRPLLQSLTTTRDGLSKEHGKQKPLLLKIAPDLSDDDKKNIAETVIKSSIDGLIVSNTTISRPATLKSEYTNESGGLSGAPLFAPSTQLLKEMYVLTAGKIPLIGVGGISSAKDAYAKIRAGASLLQLYTALIYHGMGLVAQITTGLERLLANDGFTSISEAVGIDAAIENTEKEQI